MKRQFFDFGDQWALVGALAVLAFVLAANVGYFVGRDISIKSELRNQQTHPSIHQRQPNNYQK